MHDSTGLRILIDLAKESLIEVRHTTFCVDKHPALYHHHDVGDAFRAVADKLGFEPNTHYMVAHNWGTECWCHAKLFEKLLKLLFLAEHRWPPIKTEVLGPDNSPQVPLPILTVGADKTQVRQIPLSRERPWPFKSLLELGGMIVVVPEDRYTFMAELKQFVNNHPQFEIGLQAKDRPDGSIAVHTYWFADVPKKLRKEHVNVPD